MEKTYKEKLRCYAFNSERIWELTAILDKLEIGYKTWSFREFGLTSVYLIEFKADDRMFDWLFSRFDKDDYRKLVRMF